MSQHCLLLKDMVLKKKLKKELRKELKLWRLRESEVKEELGEGISNKCDGDEDCYDLTKKLLDVASETCD